MMGLDSPIHIAFLLIVLLLVFGAKRLPELGQSLGSGMRGFKNALTDESPTTAVATVLGAADVHPTVTPLESAERIPEQAA
jgi:sec-independent protein translocase protein TatA